MKIVIDAMGGDNAPRAVVQGTMKAIREFTDIEIILVGNEQEIRNHLTDENNIAIIHTDEKITSEDEPVKAVRRKKDASMVLMAKEVKEHRADAGISAGNTGALMAAGLFYVGRIKGVDRPALSPTLPTLDKRGFVFLDAGSNMDAKPEHLLQYAIMASVYAEKVRGVKQPRVGLINIGTEEGKGNQLSKDAYALLKNEPSLHFVGNIESRDLLEGVVDVAVCDGFSGNLILKTIEGTAFSMFSLIKEQLTSNLASKIAAGILRPKFREVKKTLDYSEYGGAALFGLSAPIVKAHGSSNDNAIYNAIRQTRKMVEKNMTNVIQERMLQQKSEI
jgi:glycerol-3-phosphate acyltransferase PlsX